MSQKPEQVEVKRRVADSKQKQTQLTFLERIYNALGPVVGGLILDFTDFLTFGPIGYYLGLIIGMTIGWLIAGIYRLPTKNKIWLSVLAGVYCMIPGTAFIPIATLISAFSRFFDSKNPD